MDYRRKHDEKWREKQEDQLKVILVDFAYHYVGRNYQEALIRIQEAERRFHAVLDEAERQNLWFAEETWLSVVETAKLRCMAYLNPHQVDSNILRDFERERRLLDEALTLSEWYLKKRGERYRWTPEVAHAIFEPIDVHIRDCRKYERTIPDNMWDLWYETMPVFHGAALYELVKVIDPELADQARREVEEQQRKSKEEETSKSKLPPVVRQGREKIKALWDHQEKQGREFGKLMAEDIVEQLKRGEYWRELGETAKREGKNVLRTVLIAIDNEFRRKAGMKIRDVVPEEPRKSTRPKPEMSGRERVERVDQNEDIVQEKLRKWRENNIPYEGYDLSRCAHESVWRDDWKKKQEVEYLPVFERYEEYERRMREALEK